MRILKPLLLLCAAAAAHAAPVDSDEVASAPVPASVASVSVPVITNPPEQVDLELEKRQATDDNSTTPEDNVTVTTTVITTDVVTDLKTSIVETTSTTTIIATSTVFKTVTETESNVDTATKTVYSTTTIYKRWLEARETAAPRGFQDYHMQPRGLVFVVKRDTVFVTEVQTTKTTVVATTVETNKVVVKTTSTVTTESTVTTTEFENAKTTVTTTSFLTVTSATEDSNTIYTEGPTGGTSGTSDGSVQTGTSDGEGIDSGSSGLSTGGKIGIGVGVGVAGLFILGALGYWMMKKRKNRPEPDWYDPHNELNDSPNMPQPTVPAIAGGEMSEPSHGYRGASGPGTSAMAGGAALSAAGGAMAANRNSRKSWGDSTAPTVSPPSRFTTPADAPYPTGTGSTPPGGYVDMPNEPGQQPLSEMDGGQVQHPVEADSRPVVFEAPDRRYT